MKNGVFHSLSGKYYLKVRKYPEARELFLTAIRLNPRYSDPYFHLADMSVREGYEDRAIKWHRKGLRVDPFNPKANLSLGILYLKKGRPGLAKEVFLKALSKPVQSDEIRQRLYEGLDFAQ